MAGFSFQPEDLDQVSWLLLGALDERMEAERRKKELELALVRRR